ncbi:nucleotide exchange factor GrpE [Candidatus Woesearchaeota archaeon]|nr:nucleotide exchange factor GrpE [Candidatus Woesearchaeota archaeon]
MVKFRLKGTKQNAFAFKIKKESSKEEKTHLYGEKIYDTNELKVSFEDIYRQLGSNILWHEFDDEKEKLIKEKEELVDTSKRLQAEFENYKKRADKEKTEFTKFAHADLIAQMLPVLDSFEIAIKNTNDKEKFIEGMKMIYAQFHSILEAEGLRHIKTAGEKFDPYKHEVLMKEESDKPEDTILEEFQKGYMLNDKVLRHSKVKISGK